VDGKDTNAAFTGPDPATARRNLRLRIPTSRDFWRKIPPSVPDFAE
jgi:hypothetical protein